MKNRGDELAPATVAATTAGSPWQLRLYVAGSSPRAALAEANVRRCCEANFAGRYRLEIIDLQQYPEAARREQLLALPALVRQLPSPRRCVIGTLADEALLLSTLALGAEC